MVAVLARGEAALPRRLPSLRRQLQIAAVCHEAIRQLREELGEAPLPAWKDASEDMRASTLAGVTFRLAHPDAPVSAQHDQWQAERIAAGWRYGPVKDARRKTHPSLVPYEKLPASEKRKDRLFAAIVAALV